MSSLLYVIAVILIIAWAIGFFALHVGGSIIHVLLVLAVIAIIWRLATGNRAL